MITGVLVALIPYSTFLRRKSYIKKHVSKFQGIQNTLRVGNEIFQHPSNPLRYF